MDRFATGLRGILRAMGMGCIEGDAELIINRRGCARRITLADSTGNSTGAKPTSGGGKISRLALDR